MLKVNENSKYLYVDELTLNDYSAVEYKAVENEFITRCKDWNCDDDIYSLNVCMFEEILSNCRDYITDDQFNRNMVELTNNKYNGMFVRYGVVYTIIDKFNKLGEQLIYIKNEFDNSKIVITIERFQKEYKEIIYK